MVGVAGELDEPVEDREEGRPGMRGAGGSKGGAVELDGAAEVLEDGDKVVVEVGAEIEVKAGEEEADTGRDVTGGGERGLEEDAGGVGGEVGIDGVEGGGLGAAVGEEGR